MIIRFIQIIIRFLFVWDKNVINESIKDMCPSIDINDRRAGFLTSNNKGEIYATFSDRFMMMSYKDFASVMCGKDVCDITEDDLRNLSKQNKGKAYADKKDSKRFRENFFAIQKKFKENYKIQLGNGENSIVINAIKEEMAHNMLLKDTPTSVILNCLTLYYRICSIYLSFRRQETGFILDEKDYQVTNAMINAYSIRRIILESIYAYIEAAYHYHDDEDVVFSNYGPRVANLCKSFRVIEKKLVEKDFPKNAVQEIMQKMGKTLLYFPYAYILTDMIKAVNSKLFAEAYRGFNGTNRDFIDTIKDKLSTDDSIKPDEVLQLIDNEQQRRRTNSQIDIKFRQSFVYYSTETTEGFMPEKLKSFVITKLLLAKNKKALFRILFSHKELSNLPSLKCFGVNDEFFNIDEGMVIFRGQEFIMAQNSFEPTLAGDDGYHNLVNSKYCKTLLIQAVFLRIISYYRNNAVINTSTINDCPADLKGYFELCFEARPYTKRFRNTIYSILSEAIREGKAYLNNREKGNENKDEKGDEKISKDFEFHIKNLFEIIESYPEDEKYAFYAFCEMNYTPGY